jgi:hypothetical protein
MAEVQANYNMVHINSVNYNEPLLLYYCYAYAQGLVCSLFFHQ